MIKQFQKKKDFFKNSHSNTKYTDKFQLIPYRRSISVQSGGDIPDSISRIQNKIQAVDVCIIS
jgi:ribosomal protein S10